ncbi:MAG TPA: FxLYD domain-containing protein [Candidatus Nitrosotenuis sp.]|nr:FxLYD domain-containing protein [Candidatus Nitrosotenuis sp.]
MKIPLRSIFALALLILGPASWAGQVTTNGSTRHKSPIKVTSLQILDRTPDSYWMGGATPPRVTVKATIHNSGTVPVDNIVMTVVLLDGAGKKLTRWTENVGTLQPQEDYEFTSPPYYNYSLAWLQARVLVSHDQVYITRAGMPSPPPPPRVPSGYSEKPGFTEDPEPPGYQGGGGDQSPPGYQNGGGDQPPPGYDQDQQPDNSPPEQNSSPSPPGY